jgi:hypothetical protein
MTLVDVWPDVAYWRKVQGSAAPMIVAGFGLAVSSVLTLAMWPMLHGQPPGNDFPVILGLFTFASVVVLFRCGIVAEYGSGSALFSGGLVLALFALWQLVEAVLFERDVLVLVLVPTRYEPPLSLWVLLIVALAAWALYWGYVAIATARLPVRGEPISGGPPVTAFSMGIRRPGSGTAMSQWTEHDLLKLMTRDRPKFVAMLLLVIVALAFVYVALSFLAAPLIVLKAFTPDDIRIPPWLAMKCVDAFLNVAPVSPDAPSVATAVSFLQAGMLFVPLAAAAAAIAGALIRFAERVGYPDVAAMRNVDRRAPIFLIRSFKDDNARVRVRLGFERMFLIFQQSVSFELLLVDALGTNGPVVTIGQPKERLRRIGATREYVADAAWRDRVAEYMTEAAAVAIIVGDTEHFAWECERAVEQGLQDRMLFVFPPLSNYELRARWNRLAAVVAPARGIAFPEVRDRQILAACFPLEGEPLFFVAKVQAADTYRKALSSAVAELHLRSN